MIKETRRKTIGILIIFTFLAVCLSSQARSFFSLPSQQKLSVGDEVRISLDFPKSLLDKLQVHVQSDRKVLELNGIKLDQSHYAMLSGNPVVTSPGKVSLNLKLFGLIPLHKMVVDVHPQKTVIPGGHSIGIMVNSEGVIVVGFSPIKTESGDFRNPAQEAGLQIGDVVLKINGEKVSGDRDMARIVKKVAGKKPFLNIAISRNGKTFTKKIEPIYCNETENYRIGLYIRDSAAGVGTLTFYDPSNDAYGALGHVINDSDTRQKIDLKNGKIVKAAIHGINQGKRGVPGEKIGMFLTDDEITGNIEMNTNFGIFGKLDRRLNNPFFGKPVPVAYADQIKPGPAEILTVLDGEKIEKFKIEIEKIYEQQRPDGKGLVIKITDPKLIQKTGGIVQGMSGSPILQDGKIVGAVTHVFVNDPTKGYGILIEWMLKQTNNSKIKAAS